jgi:hypothetical protein
MPQCSASGQLATIPDARNTGHRQFPCSCCNIVSSLNMPAGARTSHRFLSCQEYESLWHNPKLLPPHHTSCTRVRTQSCTNPTSEGDFLITLYEGNSHLTSAVSVVSSEDKPHKQSARAGKRKAGADVAVPPSAELSGTVRNNGFGGDLTFAPKQDPRICTQSRIFHRPVKDANGESVPGREVREVI